MEGEDGGGLSIEGGKVLFSACKNESHTPKQGFKQLFRRLRSMYRPEQLSNKDDFTLDSLKQAAIVIFGCPRERFTTTEFEVLKKYIRQGGSVLVLLHEGGEERAGTNINYFLEEYGVSVNPDSVVRTTHYKYLHPKEVLISDGILNRAITQTVGSSGNKDQDDVDYRSGRGRGAKEFDGTGLEFVYPYGATLSVLKPAVPVLSSGKIAYPMNRPLGECTSGGSGVPHADILPSCTLPLYVPPRALFPGGYAFPQTQASRSHPDPIQIPSSCIASGFLLAICKECRPLSSSS